LEIINAVLPLGMATWQSPRKEMKRVRQKTLNASRMQRGKKICTKDQSMCSAVGIEEFPCETLCDNPRKDIKETGCVEEEALS